METKKSRQRFTEEFKVEAVKQVTDKGFAVAEVAMRLGCCASSSPTKRKLGVSWRATCTTN